MDSKLLWLKELGIGYYPVTDSPYDEDYFNKYVNYEKTEVGQKLNDARVNLVNFYNPEDIVDIGIGSGMFVKSFKNAKGLDINPVAVRWLKDNQKWYYGEPVESMTFWDSLEHIHNPRSLLLKAKKLVFVSCPIYENVDHVLSSKHFRPDEHCWYFTLEGICNFMRIYDFRMIQQNRMEEECGREDIGTFVFKRVMI